MNSEFIIKSLLGKVKFLWEQEYTKKDRGLKVQNTVFKDKNIETHAITSNSNASSKGFYWDWLENVVRLVNSNKNRSKPKNNRDKSKTLFQSEENTKKNQLVAISRYEEVKDYLIKKSPLALQYVDMVMEYLEKFNYLHLDWAIIEKIALSIKEIDLKFQIGFDIHTQTNYKRDKNNQYPLIEKYRKAQTTPNYWGNRINNERSNPGLGI